jgi:hypothetical protein
VGGGCDDGAMVLLLAAVSILAFVGVIFYLQRQTAGLDRLLRRHLKVLATGQAATGEILGIRPTGRVGGTKNFPVFEMELDVDVSVPGQASYTVKTRQLIDQHRLASVQPRQLVFLRVDPRKPKSIVLTDTAGEEVEARYRDTPAGDKAPPAAPAEPLFSPQSVRSGLVLMKGLLVFLVLAPLGIFLRFGMNWAALSPPPGGFCEAAVRCCKQIPRDPLPESLIKMTSQGPFPLGDVCAFSQEGGERACQRMYEHFRKEAQSHQIRCE